MQQYTHGRPLMMVCAAAPEDAELLGHWETHLQILEQAHLISIWSHLHLAPGADALQEQQQRLAQADIVLLLLSASFFDSPDCLALMDAALERAQTGGIRVIPLLLRPVAWQESPLGTLAPWPPNGKPILLWNHQDEGWEVCVQELRRLLDRRVSEALPPQQTTKHADPDWERMLRRLRRSYKELLDQSLHGIAWVELGLATHPEMVSNVTNLLFRLPQGGERLLAPGTSILDAFDEAEGELLILGAPGAGKSTLLLDLSLQLVNRALANPTYPLPVILRLSSWTLERPALADWMVEQLSHTYDVPHRLSERWITQGRLLPLLDGLDEMEEAARPACIATINTYHRMHLTPLVVCSRQTEYEAAATRYRLTLQSAIIVQPLSDEQIEEYLGVAGSSFTGVRTALQQEQALRELATTPLMLSVLLQTYRGTTASEIIQQGTDLERQVWTDYVARQVAEKGNNTHYSLERTRAWLSWLAGQMHAHQQTLFSAEYLQDDWLARDQQRTITWLATRLPAIVLGGCVGLLVWLLMGGERSLESLLQIGLLGGFVGSHLSRLQPIGVRGKIITHMVHARTVLLLGLLVAVSQGLSFLSIRGYLLRDWFRDGCILGLGSLLSGWMLQMLLARTPKQWVAVLHTSLGLRGRLAAWMNTMGSLHLWQAALVFGGGMGLSYGLSYGIRFGLSYGLINGLQVSVIVVLARVILAGMVGSLRFAERIHWTWRGLLQTKHLRTSLIIAGTLFLFFGLSYALSVGLSSGLINGLNYGLSSGLINGLSVGLSVGLSYWILLGLYQGMKQEHLEDQDRQRFNQGIHRSLRNGLLISLLSALLISVIGVLSGALSYGLSYGLSDRLSYGLDTLSDTLSFALSYGLSYALSYGLSYGIRFGLSFALSLLFPAMVVMWALSGGLTILRHYVIRWLLARHHTFPWRAQTFLDDATTRILMRRVGGGYSFIHRRLQDYFADVEVPPPQK